MPHIEHTTGNKMPPDAPQVVSEFICGGCDYFGWNGLQKWCRHPRYNRQISGPGCKKQEFRAYDDKLLPNEKIPERAPMPERKRKE